MRPSKWIAAMTLIAALAITHQLSAQNSPNHKPKHHQYKLYDMGTFGGPSSYINVLLPNLNSEGDLAGGSETSALDPYSPNCFSVINNSAECLVTHAFRFRKGVATDLGTLPGGGSSQALALNDQGTVVGISENGAVDPLTGYPAINAVEWTDRKITNLGTFGGSISVAYGINSHGQIVGQAETGSADPYSFGMGPCFYLTCWPSAHQQHAFLWERGVLQDLGTLGGNDSQAQAINEAGEVAGTAYTNTTPNPTTGIPTADPFLWRNGRMIDLGSLGGTYGFPNSMNNRGQVVGQSNLAGDQVTHPFLWSKGVLTDLGSLGGGYATALAITETGEVVGYSLTGNGQPHGFRWIQGHMSDLGTLAGDLCSAAFASNAQGQVVGVSGPSSCQGTKAALWESDGSVADLNALISPHTDVALYWAVTINDSGQIGALGMPSGGGTHAYLLVPDGNCDED